MDNPYIISPELTSHSSEWEFVGFTSNDFEALCLVHCEISKAWSVDLLRKYPNSRWVTYRGNRLLIRGNKDGTASVVFSANPAFEHLRIIPKTSEEYKKIKADKDKPKEDIGDAESYNKEVEQGKKLKAENEKKRNQQITELKEKFVNIVADIVGNQMINSAQENGKNNGLQNIENEKKSKNKDEIGDKLLKINELDEKNKRIFAYGAKEKAVKEVLRNTLDVSGISPEALGLDVEISTGSVEIDRMLADLTLTEENALQIAGLSNDLKDAIKSVNQKFKISVKKEKPLEITSLQGLGIKNLTHAQLIKDIVLKEAVEKIEAQQRIENNVEFYNHLENRMYNNDTIRSSARRLFLEGAQSTINAVAGVAIENGGFSRDVLDFLGAKNASLLLAQAIHQKGEGTKTKSELEKALIDRAKNVVSASLEKTREKYEVMEGLRNLAEDATIATATANIHIARAYGDIGRELSLSGGSLESASTILDGLRDTTDLQKNITVDGGDNFDSLAKKLKKMKLFDKVLIKPRVGGFAVEIPYENVNSILLASKGTKDRDTFVQDLKQGKLTEKDYLPKGQNPVAYDTISESNYSELKKENKESGYESFVNTKGENGYTSKMPEGSTLYRKPFEVKVNDSQQEGIKFIENQKRVVLDFGAGLGKTYTYLGAVSQLKETGKLKDSFAVLSPPSRLRAEFFKDKEKFFPNMNVLEIDDIVGKSGSSYGTSLKQLKGIFGQDADVKALRELSTYDLQQKAIERAKQGFFDVVLTGHDSVKEGRTYQIIADAKPAFVGIDEAHEIIQETKDSGAQSKRLKAMKSMADSAEYFVAGTGTTVKNSIAELGTLLHIARPDVVTDAKKFGNKYENINQGTTMFQDGAVNQFRKEFDDIMLSRRSEVKGAKLLENKQKVNITPEQRKAWAKTEAQYHLDRKAKGKIGIYNSETNEIDFIGKNQLRTFEKHEIDFKTGGDIPSPKEIAFLKANGIEGKKRIVELSGSGASQRRDYAHERTLHGGDWRQNAKMLKIAENIKARPNEKHGVLYKNKFSKPALTNMLLDNGYKESEIVFIDGSVTNENRDKAVTEFQQNPNVKIIVFGEAGATGLNLQAMDNLHHLTRLDTDAKQKQANARAYRNGRKSDVNVFYYDSDTPLDNKKVQNLEKKKRLSEAVGEYQQTQTLL